MFLNDARGRLLSARAAWAMVLAFAMLWAMPGASLAQLTPDRTYYGFGREIPVSVSVPDGQSGDPAIVLFEPSGARVARAEVLAGRVDLATFFPILWGQNEPRVLYAQLFAAGDGGEGAPIGPPLVIQPLVSPRMATATRNGIDWQGGQPIFSGLRLYVDKLVKMTTTEGEILFRLRPDEAPNTVWHIRQLVEGGFYTDIAFHRVLPTHPSGQPFVIQVGDPTGTGQGGPGVFIDLEPSELEHAFGVLSMARTPDPNTNGSQFFVALSKEATAHLNGVYTAFGQAVSGADVIVAIEQTPLADARAGRPVDAPRIVSAELVDAPAFGTGPEPVTRPAPTGER